MGGWVVGWVGGWLGGEKSKLKLNSAQLKLKLGLSLAKNSNAVNVFISSTFNLRLSSGFQKQS